MRPLPADLHVRLDADAAAREQAERVRLEQDPLRGLGSMVQLRPAAADCLPARELQTLTGR